METIDIGKKFSTTPIGRYLSDSSNSGERFREDFLVPSLKEGKVIVIIDTTEGYGSSFMEEAFGGLVRVGHFTQEELKKLLSIQYEDPAFEVFEMQIWQYISEAKLILK